MSFKMICAIAAVIGGPLVFGYCLATELDAAAITVPPIIFGIIGAVGSGAGVLWWHGLIKQAVEDDLEEHYREIKDNATKDLAVVSRRVRYALPADADEIRDRLLEALSRVGEAAGIVIQEARTAVGIFPELETKLGEVAAHIEHIKGEREKFRADAMRGAAAHAILSGETVLPAEPREEEPSTPPPPGFIQARRRPTAVPREVGTPLPAPDLESGMTETIGRAFPRPA